MAVRLTPAWRHALFGRHVGHSRLAHCLALWRARDTFHIWERIAAKP